MTGVAGVTGATPGPSLRRALTGAAVVVTITWLAIVALWEDAPFALTFDDAWYYFGIARNIVAGHGSTFDQLNPTNGYHPLWMGVSVLAFKLGFDDLGAARALLALQVVVGWGAALVLVAETATCALRDWPRVRRVSGRPPSAAVWTLAVSFVLIGANPFVVKVFVNGMESGIAVTCYAALLYLALRWQGAFLDGGAARQLSVGVLLSVTFLARTDAVFAIACFAIWCFAERISFQRGTWAAFARLFVPPVVVGIVYLLYNKATFGTWVQISGLVKREPMTVGRVAAFASVVLLASLAARQAFRGSHRGPGGEGHQHRRFPHTGEAVAATGWYAAACILIAGYYTVLQNQQWLWYYAPLVVYGVLLLLLAIADFVEATLQQAPAASSPQRTLLPVELIIGVLLTASMVILAGQFADPNLRSIQQANRAAGEWARANLPNDAVLASWDAGAFGYFSHRRVVNLDGVVNSYDWWQATQRGPAAVAEFLACDGVAYIANHGADVDGRDPDIDGFAREVLGDDDPTVVYRLPFAYSGVTVGSRGRSSDDGNLAVHIYELTPSDSSWPPACSQEP